MTWLKQKTSSFLCYFAVVQRRPSGRRLGSEDCPAPLPSVASTPQAATAPGITFTVRLAEWEARGTRKAPLPLKDVPRSAISCPRSCVTNQNRVTRDMTTSSCKGGGSVLPAGGDDVRPIGACRPRRGLRWGEPAEGPFPSLSARRLPGCPPPHPVPCRRDSHVPAPLT